MSLSNTHRPSSLSRFLEELDEPCLLLARHGETDWNALNLIQGQQDRPLSVEGFRQRKNLFCHLRGVRLGMIVTSSLQRTRVTAQPISEELHLPLDIRPELDEVRLGVFEGEHKFEFADGWSQETYKAFLEDEINVALPGGGESLRMVYDRISIVMPSIVDKLGVGGHTLVVAHRNVNKMIIKYLLGLTFAEGYGVEHLNTWLYIYASQRQELYSTQIQSPGAALDIKSGYERVL
jgi:probable phosphoglycerate mutase